MSTKTSQQASASPFIFAGFTGDRSGSMQGIYNESAQGLYEWSTELIEGAIQNNQKGRMFITCFDNKAEKRLDNVEFRKTKLTLDNCKEWMKPRGSTRLYDTAIEDLENIVQKAEEFKQNLPRNVRILNPEISIVWACCTDGFDNSSMNTSEDLKNKVLWAREKGVKCFFLAANQDAVTTGESYGFSPDQSLTYTASAENAPHAFRSISNNMRQASCGKSYAFTQLQRDSSQRTSPNLRQQALHNSRQKTLRQTAKKCQRRLDFTNVPNTTRYPSPIPLRRSQNVVFE